LKVRDPDGFVSDAAYLTPTPAGSAPTDTRAVSLADRIWIGMVTEAAPGMMTTVEIGRYTEIGFVVTIPLLPEHPGKQPANEQARTSRTDRRRREKLIMSVIALAARSCFRKYDKD